MRVVRVSGTIRKAEEEAVRRARDSMLRAQKAMAERAVPGMEQVVGENAAIMRLRQQSRLAQDDDGRGEIIVDDSDDDEEEEVEDEDDDND